MRAAQKADGMPVGLTTIGNTTFDTTGVLGLSTNAGGQLEARGFPSWITLPSYRDLATGRRWHFFFAWAFVLNGIVVSRIRTLERTYKARSCSVATAIAKYRS